MSSPTIRGVDVIGAFVSEDRLKVAHVATALILVGDAIGPEGSRALRAHSSAIFTLLRLARLTCWGRTCRLL